MVVVTYNRATMLRQALATLITQRSHSKFSFEILVIDDGSTDDTASVVREMATQAEPLPIRYVYKEGGGEGDARNRGVAEAQGQRIAFCDDDQQADPGWLAQLYEAAREKGALCVGGSVSLVAPDLGRIMLGPRARRFLGEKRLSANLSSPEAKLFLGAKVQQFEEDLLHYVTQNHPELRKELTSIGKIDEAVGTKLKQMLTTFKQKMGYGAK